LFSNPATFIRGSAFGEHVFEQAGVIIQREAHLPCFSDCSVVVAVVVAVTSETSCDRAVYE
jgi:hypothetical protein